MPGTRAGGRTRACFSSACDSAVGILGAVAAGRTCGATGVPAAGGAACMARSRLSSWVRDNDKGTSPLACTVAQVSKPKAASVVLSLIRHIVIMRPHSGRIPLHLSCHPKDEGGDRPSADYNACSNRCLPALPARQSVVCWLPNRGSEWLWRIVRIVCPFRCAYTALHGLLSPCWWNAALLQWSIHSVPALIFVPGGWRGIGCERVAILKAWQSGRAVSVLMEEA